MSSAKWSKVVRTESLLDEYNIYFSHVLSPFKKVKKPIAESTSVAKPHHQQNGVRKDNEKEYANVDAEAEKFIKKKHQKFELSALKSTLNEDTYYG